MSYDPRNPPPLPDAAKSNPIIAHRPWPAWSAEYLTRVYPLYDNQAIAVLFDVHVDTLKRHCRRILKISKNPEYLRNRLAEARQVSNVVCRRAPDETPDDKPIWASEKNLVVDQVTQLLNDGYRKDVAHLVVHNLHKLVQMRPDPDWWERRTKWTLDTWITALAESAI